MLFTGVDLGGGHGLAVGDVDVAAEFWSFIGTAEHFVGAEEAGGDDGGFGFTGDHAGSGFGLGQLAVWRAGAFGVDGDDAFGFERSEDGFEGFNLGVFTSDRDCPDLDEAFAKESLKEGVAGEIIDRPMDAGTDGGRIVEADVIGRKDDGAALGHVLQAALSVVVKCVEIPRRDVADELVELWIRDGAIGHSGSGLDMWGSFRLR